MKKICFVTTVSITIKSFLLQFKDYLVNKDYDVTFICNTDESMYELCNDQVHYIPVPMKRGVGLDGLSVINKLTKILEKINLILSIFNAQCSTVCINSGKKSRMCKSFILSVGN